MKKSKPCPDARRGVLHLHLPLRFQQAVIYVAGLLVFVLLATSCGGVSNTGTSSKRRRKTAPRRYLVYFLTSPKRESR